MGIIHRRYLHDLCYYSHNLCYYSNYLYCYLNDLYRYIHNLYRYLHDLYCYLHNLYYMVLNGVTLALLEQSVSLNRHDSHTHSTNDNADSVIDIAA